MSPLVIGAGADARHHRGEFRLRRGKLVVLTAAALLARQRWQHSSMRLQLCRGALLQVSFPAPLFCGDTVHADTLIKHCRSSTKRPGFVFHQFILRFDCQRSCWLAIRGVEDQLERSYG